MTDSYKYGKEDRNKNDSACVTPAQWIKAIIYTGRTKDASGSKKKMLMLNPVNAEFSVH